MNSAKVQNITQLLASYGLEYEEPPAKLEDAKRVKAHHLLGELVNGERKDADTANVLMQFSEAQRRGELLRQLSMEDEASKLRELADKRARHELAEDEIGSPGSLYYDGKLSVESTSKYAPYQVRGHDSNPGMYEDFYRQEPTFRDSVDNQVDTQLGAEHECQMPKELPDDISPEEMQEWVDKINGWLANLEGGGLRRYVFNAAHSVSIFGFAPFEVVWDSEDGDVFPVKFGYRECSTVERWIMDERMDTLLAVDFSVGGDNQFKYTLSATGEALTDHRFMLARIAGRGNNWEGIAPARPAMHWMKFKQLLAHIAAASAQKYGVPTTFIKLDPSFFKLVGEYMSSTSSANADVKDVVEKLSMKQAVECVIVGLPDGLTADTPAPPGTMPALEDLLRYCDEMIARPFSNEGSLLGHNNVGSYALADVQDDKFLRGAPSLHRVIMEPVDKLIRLMTIARFDRQLRFYPEMGMRLNVAHDTGSFIADVVSLYPGKSIDQYHEKIKRAVAEKLGVDPDTFDEMLAEEIEAQHGIAPPDDKTAQTDSKRPDDSGVADDTDEDEDTALGDVAGCGCHYCEDSAKLVQLDDQQRGNFIELAETMDAGQIKRKMDAMEKRLTRKLNSIAESQRREFRDASKNVTGPMELKRLSDEVAEMFFPQYQRAITHEARNISNRGARQLLKEFGVGIPKDFEAPGLGPKFGEQLMAQIVQLSETASYRNAKWARDQRVDQINDTRIKSVKKVAKSTLFGIAAQVTGRAFNAGRDSLMFHATQYHEAKTGEKPRYTCVRSSMLDGAVCDPCASLDFENGGPTFIVNSANYFRHVPPAVCLGRNRCRCVLIYETTPELKDDLQQLVNAKFAISDLLSATI